MHGPYNAYYVEAFGSPDQNSHVLSSVSKILKRQKNNAADVEAIVEAAIRPSMRFVVPKTEKQQAVCMVFRTRDLLVGQRTQLINALRAHLAEHGIIAPKELRTQLLW